MRIFEIFELQAMVVEATCSDKVSYVVRRLTEEREAWSINVVLRVGRDDAAYILRVFSRAWGLHRLAPKHDVSFLFCPTFDLQFRATFCRFRLL